MRAKPIVLDAIPFSLDRAELASRLGMPDAGPLDPDLEALIQRAEKVARPKAVFTVSFIDERTDGQTVIDGIRFESRVLQVNLDPIHRVFPHVVSCGTEIQQWSEGISDPVESFWADAIKELALRSAVEHFQAHVRAAYALGRVSHMNPGSLPDWPLPQQRPLFQLLGEVEALIGVRLTESFLMLPTKSISGILFPAETSFESCELCPREVCPGRRAPYDPTLYERRYGAKAAHGP